MWAAWPDGGGCDHSTGGTGPFRDFAMTVASNPVGAGAASQTDTHGVGKFVTALTGGSVGTEAHFAGDVAVGVASPAVLSGGVAVGVASPTIAEASSAVAGVASLVELAVVSPSEWHPWSLLGRCPRPLMVARLSDPELGSVTCQLVLCPHQNRILPGM